MKIRNPRRRAPAISTRRQIGVVIGIQTEASAEDISVVGRDVAMQAASMRPQFVDESSVDPEYLEHEKQILIAQALHEGKPAEIVEKMVVGRLKKELKETCLVEQKFVKNNDMSVKEYGTPLPIWERP